MDSTTSLLIESWTLYLLGVLLVACRLVSRRLKLGKWRNLTMDDYLMLFALANFTGVVVSINQVAKDGSSYMSPEDAASLTPEGVQQAVYGSILTFALEIFTVTATWTIKACLLILYARLTGHTLPRQHALVKIAAAYCAITYLLVILLFIFYWCSPRTYEYWAVPVRIEECATYYHHMIFATACNISSDLLLLLISIPIIINTLLPIKRKLFLICILGLGVLNILAAILNRYYNFSNPDSYVFLCWYVAEVGIAILVGNMPLCWPLLRMVLGMKEKLARPSCRGSTINGGCRRHGKLRRTLGASTLESTAWDKIDDQDEAKASGCRTSTDHHTASDRVSEIELIYQGQTKYAPCHQAAVSANAEQSAEMPSSDVGAAGLDGDSHRSVAAGDKIMVVTTVEVSSSEPARQRTSGEA
ncbi:uncharacterized protein UV8b_05857 [Ustilaginoidea virens]|uniref:Rhodopsin domain-containing protein n=1 Tax=Ustilaginoidea virens TaxID=1159556 RepID=A0A8E5HUS6_USTVR|nr:uncharacterized protein UV8b_05857 [Ustilaginoidea virens]QUC21614.1 hypothetical protein UV8b_05857 [Ustilaginoidea virens]